MNKKNIKLVFNLKKIMDVSLVYINWNIPLNVLMRNKKIPSIVYEVNVIKNFKINFTMINFIAIIIFFMIQFELGKMRALAICL